MTPVSQLRKWEEHRELCRGSTAGEAPEESPAGHQPVGRSGLPLHHQPCEPQGVIFLLCSFL